MPAISYNDIDPGKKAFIFELDDVLYPAKDYYYQIYYLFANLLEYTELNSAARTTELMIDTYNKKGAGEVYNELVAQLSIEEKYRDKLEIMLLTSRLPLKLLLFKNMLSFMQEVVTDRKRLFIVTNGSPQQQLNKLRQIEWHGLEPYLTCYFADESLPKPEPDILHLLMKEHNLERRDLLMISGSDTDTLCAETCGIDYINVGEII
ncbi:MULTISPECIES: HAD hydrolase-like protein [unclassified Mucilaginibacter]|uniref:HAD family hydrolase n=1 Tax=unclassified Mucilaginibacter TaxID=2617802 RepID=UPI002AC926D3|nr:MULTISPECIES: HAD hydrolase-like protein [unclassified Mucilaginibacter]MEB0262476.1 HAD hydrolase-like protein [Mucilaginibacter sp. 10I4]MEB0279916.1 HAD hydrolase-like protein [Mucilaginibacter sp. 10B2]MEB0300062.1 HAD hydrolase-like protein [Mucilaginibacter sp. 5C4]WPX21874.1 HAD hydrolase-like protein [Mucilaginibacter sp. 5C4]